MRRPRPGIAPPLIAVSTQPPSFLPPTVVCNDRLIVPTSSSFSTDQDRLAHSNSYAAHPRLACQPFHSVPPSTRYDLAFTSYREQEAPQLRESCQLRWDDTSRPNYTSSFILWRDNRSIPPNASASPFPASRTRRFFSTALQMPAQVRGMFPGQFAHQSLCVLYG